MTTRSRARARIVALLSVLPLLAGTSLVQAQELAKGTILGDVKCAADPTESYALYLPSTYSPERSWKLLMAFHPSARGRALVELYRNAAEQYRYIVAVSNRSRNGPWAVSLKAVLAMSEDLGHRFTINNRRIYLTGMSGGARVALASQAIAGVIASSAGFPDSQPRQAVSFPLFATAGTEDFNYLEMRRLDGRLTSPHRLAIFYGSHSLPPETVAVEAIEWLENLRLDFSRSAQRGDRLVMSAAVTQRGAPATVRACMLRVQRQDGLETGKRLIGIFHVEEQLAT